MEKTTISTKNPVAAVSAKNPVSRFFNNMRIANKLTLLYSAMVTLILLLFTMITVLSVYAIGIYQSNRVLTIAATTVVNGITEKSHLFENNLEFALGSDLYIVVYSENGEMLRKPDSLSADSDLIEDGIEDGGLEVFGRVFRRQFFDDAAYINRSIMFDDEVFIVQVILDYRTELRMITLLAVTLASLLLLGTAASVFIGRRMSRHMLKPIGEMTKSANSIQHEGALLERLPVANKKDEITDLGNTINSMLDRIESYSTTLTQFVSDASHELRTPITVLLSHAEMLKKWAMDDREALERCVDSMEKEALFMKQLVERLLKLARADTKRLSLALERFSLDELVLEVFEDTCLMAGERQVSLTANHVAKITSDRNCLKELLRILIDNSIKYTAADGTIKISSTISENTAKLSVWDNGIGIKRENINKVFDRFFCCDVSRNKKKSGSGLGLSIAKALAAELGFSITADSVEGEYTVFEICCPLKE